MNIENQEERVAQLKSALQQVVANHSILLGRIAEAEEVLVNLKANSEAPAVEEVKKNSEAS